MNVSVAPSAPPFDPVQGASRKSAPLAANAAPICLLTVGEIVLQSAVTLPGRAPARMPFGPSATERDISGSPTQ